MHTYSKNGARQSKVTHNKKVKKHVTGFYKTLSLLDGVAEQIKTLEVEVTEDNIEKLAFDVMGREIDSMEKFLLLGKIGKDDNRSE